MRKVKLMTLKAGPEGVFQPGQVLSVENEEGQQLVDGGYAVWADLPEKESPVTEETAPTDEPPAASAPKRKR